MVKPYPLIGRASQNFNFFPADCIFLSLDLNHFEQCLTPRSRLGVIYDDIRHLAAGLHYVSFNCIRCSANSVAHSLARYANVLDEEVVWLEETPPPALDALYFDSSFLNE